MKISEVINQLQCIQSEHGDIDCQLQEPDLEHGLCDYPDFFIVPEKYLPADGGWAVNIRSFPY